ncbi:MAG: alpha-amylase family glycosyl hydrolase [Bacteroidales bacterium]|nr:alpha-amylase family glycosyl hydrolase [Bacteroidales bacterium]
MTIYQIFTRLYGNPAAANVPVGTMEQNGCAKMNGFTDKVLRRIKTDGYTHVWYTGLIEHATQTDYSAFGIAKDHPVVVKGKAGSPYAIKDYYDIDPDLATKVPQRMKEFEALVARTHKAGLKMIIDFVPNHVARQYRSDAAPEGVKDLGVGDDKTMHFSPKNNFYYCWGEPLHTDFAARRDADEYPYIEQPAKATGNDHFDAWPGQNDWYETVKLNYGVDYCNAGGRSCHFDPIPSTWKKMRDILLFWAAKGVDAFRCDMAEMVPVEFWEWCIKQVKRKFKAVEFIAEVYNPAEYRNYIHRGGFDYLYDKVGLYDTLRGVICRQTPAGAITGQWQNVDDIRQHMLYFLENHDEQRIASPQFCGDAVKALPALVCEALMGTNPLMIYAGQELGETATDAEGFSGRDGRTTIFDYWSVEKLNKLHALSASGKTTVAVGKNAEVLTPEETALFDYYHRVLTMRETQSAFTDGLFYDVMYVNYDNHQGFNPDRHYAFLRHSKEQTALVVCNFSDEAAEMGVKIPAHAFDFFGMEEGSVKATELLSGKKTTLTLYRDGFADVSVPANGAVVIVW